MQLEVQPAGREEAVWFSSRLRADDEREVRAATGNAPLYSLLMGVERGEAYTMRAPGEDPCVLFGVAEDPMQPGVGVCWLLATPSVKDHGLAVVDTAGKWINRFHLTYETLHNLIDARNVLHARWCKLLGFKVHGTVRHNGLPFFHIVKRKEMAHV